MLTIFCEFFVSRDHFMSSLSSHQILTNLFKFPHTTHLCSFRKWRKQFALKVCLLFFLTFTKSSSCIGSRIQASRNNCPWRCLCLWTRLYRNRGTWSLAGAGAHTTVIRAVGIWCCDVSEAHCPMFIPPIPRPQGSLPLDNFFQKLVACIQKCLSPCNSSAFYSLLL